MAGARLMPTVPPEIHPNTVQRIAWSIGLALLLLITLALAFAEPVWADPGPAQLSGRVVDLLGKPVAGANVHAMSHTGEERVVRTDRDGRYRVELRDGAYSVVFAARGKSAQRSATLPPGAAAVLDGELELGEGEVIEIRDLPPPAVPPRPLEDPRIALPYSDQAVLRDAWTKAWLLLDVSATGEVTQLKVLKRPGFDLDDIALRSAFALHFDPARDRNGKPIPTLIVWGMEWPSYGWLQQFETTTRIPPLVRDPLQPQLPALSKVPCAGSGPMYLGSLYPAYRDCSRPDLTLASTLPWVKRP
jgi:hypothetical protein